MRIELDATALRQAVVVVRPGADLDRAAILAHCRANLADYKCPKEIVLMAELPRNPMGKVQKFKLIEQLDNS